MKTNTNTYKNMVYPHQLLTTVKTYTHEDICSRRRMREDFTNSLILCELDIIIPSPQVWRVIVGIPPPKSLIFCVLHFSRACASLLPRLCVYCVVW